MKSKITSVINLCYKQVVFGAESGVMFRTWLESNFRLDFLSNLLFTACIIFFKLILHFPSGRKYIFINFTFPTLPKIKFYQFYISHLAKNIFLSILLFPPDIRYVFINSFFPPCKQYLFINLIYFSHLAENILRRHHQSFCSAPSLGWRGEKVWSVEIVLLHSGLAKNGAKIASSGPFLPRGNSTFAHWSRKQMDPKYLQVAHFHCGLAEK